MRFRILAMGLVVMAGVASVPGSARCAEPAPLVRLSLDTEAGYDDGLLADPENLGLLRASSSSLLVVEPSLRFRRSNLRSESARDRAELELTAGFGHYGTASIGPDRDLRGSASYRTALGWRSYVQVEASLARFRRSGLPVFDFDWPEVRGRFTRGAAGTWFASLEAGHARPSYPGRPLASGGNQEDHRTDVAGTLARSFRRNGHASLRASLQRVTSSDSLAAHDGLGLAARAGMRIAPGFDLGARMSLARRRYSRYPVLVMTPADTIDTGDSRLDRSLELGLSAERRLTARVSLWAGVLWLRQTSNVDALGYHETRVSGGLRVDLWSAGSEGRARSADSFDPAPAGTGQPSFAPEVKRDGVLFRVHAPGAHQVSLVGNFNHWDEAQNPLRGPDPSGAWAATVRLPPGTCRYAFIIDGRWTRPPDAPRYESDGFGGEHGVIEVRPE